APSSCRHGWRCRKVIAAGVLGGAAAHDRQADTAVDTSSWTDVFFACGRRDATWREFTAAVSAAGGASVAMDAVERVGAERSARGRAVRAGGPAPEPRLLSPAPAT